MTAFVDRREILAGLAAATALAALPAKAAGTDTLSFLVIGDWGRDGADHQREVAVQMDKAAAETGARFTVAVGDNFYENGVASVDDAKWRTSFEDVYTGAHLQTPWYAVLGNHDYGEAPQAQVDYSAKSSRWRMPARYFKVGGAELGFPAADLFFIDTTPLVESYGHKPGPRGDNVRAQDGAAQLAWLDRELAASTAPRKIVFGHHTLFSGGSAHGDTPEIVARVLPILKARGVFAYINGHDHDLQHIQRDGLHVICSGAGSEVRPVARVEGTQFCVSQSGFAVVTLTPAGMAVEFRDYLGQSLYKAELAQVAAAA